MSSNKKVPQVVKIPAIFKGHVLGNGSLTVKEDSVSNVQAARAKIRQTSHFIFENVHLHYNKNVFKTFSFKESASS